MHGFRLVAWPQKRPRDAVARDKILVAPLFAPFLLVHVSCLAVFWTGVTVEALLAGIGLFVVRMWFVTAGYHRYFAHRAFRTSRWFQFVLAFGAQTSVQQGVLWWAAHHRQHHHRSDRPGDTHSPVRDGLWYSHWVWIFEQDSLPTHLERVPDLARCPELRLLNTLHLLPSILLGGVVYALLGLPGLTCGLISTVLLWHATFTINSLAHLWGTRRYATSDDSRNNRWLAWLTLGEGWHNNHHRYPASAANGFFDGETDVTYDVLVVLARLGIVWDLRPVPEHVLTEGRGTP